MALRLHDAVATIGFAGPAGLCVATPTCDWRCAPPPWHSARMTTRDNWQVHLSCPICGAVGEAQVSEDDQPFARRTGTLSVDRVSDGFRTVAVGSTMRTTKFECIRCGVPTQR
jgi:hypothetical protein